MRGRVLGGLSDRKIERHFERMVGRAVEHWASETLIPQLQELFSRTQLDGVMERVVKRKLGDVRRPSASADDPAADAASPS